MAQSKFEQYLEILNNKQPKRSGSAVEVQENSPLRTKHYLKTLNGEEPSPNQQSSLHQPGTTDPDQHQSQGKGRTYDFSQAELPFSNFASVQETRETRMMGPDNATTIASNDEQRHATGPTLQEYYSLAKTQGQRQADQLNSFQAQIDTIQSTLTLLLDKYDGLDYRLGFCEGHITEKFEGGGKGPVQRDGNNDSQATQHTRSTSQLRMHQKQSAMKNQAVNLPPDLLDRMNNVQIQMDHLDGKVNQLRDEQLRQNIDPKPLIAEQIDALAQHIELKYAKKSALTASIDNLGEEIAGDINSFEGSLRIETDRIQGMAEAMANFQSDLKICQISIAKIPLPIDANSETQNFSETLVKQLLRQGEDRKTSVEETKMLQSKIQEVKLTQKRHREQQLKQSKMLNAFEEEIRKNSNMMERIRAQQHKITTVQTSNKFNKGETVTKDELSRLKERINTAFQQLLRMHEHSVDRDATIVDSLLETQLGKLRRLIVKKHTHESLKQFQDILNEPFEPPEILLSLKPEAVWRQVASNETTQKTAGMRRGVKRSRSTSQKKVNKSQNRSRSRSTNGSRHRGGTQRLSSNRAIGESQIPHSMTHKQPLDAQRRTVYRQHHGQQPYQDQSENDYYRENPSVDYDDINGTTDGEGDETVSYIEEIPMPPRRQRSKSKRRDSRHRRHISHHQDQYDENGRNISRSSKRSVSQRSELSKKSSRSERVRKDYLRHQRPHRQSRDGRKHKRSRQTHHQSQVSSNKDLEANSTRNEPQQQFPMFGYQVNSSDTTGMGDIYETTKNKGAHQGSRKITSGSRQLKPDQVRSSDGHQRGAAQNQQYATSNFAGEDESIILDQKQEASQNAILEASKQSLNSKKNSYNYDTSIQMWKEHNTK